MNNEPVAIVKKLTLGGGDNFMIERFVSLKEGTLLYTHPAKTLTRDEVEEVFWKWREESDYKNLALYEFRNIANAILRKTQEK